MNKWLSNFRGGRRNIRVDSRVRAVGLLVLVVVAACEGHLERREVPKQVTLSPAEGMGGMVSMGQTPPVPSVAGSPVGMGGSIGLGGDSGLGGAAGPVEEPACTPALAHDALRARPQVMSNQGSSRPTPVLVSSLFGAFSALCGDCHVKAAFGSWQVDLENFPTKFDAAAMGRIQTDDRALLMPPEVKGGIPWSQRKNNKNDQLVQLVDQLTVWMAEGKPADLFFLDPPPADPNVSPYLLSTEVGESLTGIGNCVPNKALVGSESAKAFELDKKFAAMKATNKDLGLPKSLRDTDMFTLDSFELARYGVVAYSPTYPLWTDDAGKLRYVRVPMGKSIQYDPGTRDFMIPENTRFYKTFFTKVVDEEGNVAHRKIETRLIVSRPDKCDQGACVPQALMGTYIWNEAETEATLQESPLRNGDLFADYLKTYYIDEKKAIEAGNDVEALRKVTRHYAVPGKQRCIDCHSGSSNQSFVLGFGPLQVHRVPFEPADEPSMVAAGGSGSGPVAPPTLKKGKDLVGNGVLEEYAPKRDELTQLQRLIDYGIITGLGSADEVVTLRRSQRGPPRNIYELKAQGYLYGNCAHCHNPRGFASVRNPVLSRLLNFFPSQQGGIFNLPLERTSPRVVRSQGGVATPVVYVTPSLYDLEISSSPKHGILYAVEEGGTYVTRTADVLAPWRSLIYRNVDTPFTYSDNGAIFPHMPMHSPGFDCRAPRIVGSWMASIPARWTKSQSASKAVPPEVNSLPQPYEEAILGHDDYDAEWRNAEARVWAYQQGERYRFCPDTSDIVDPLVGSAGIPEDLAHRYALPSDEFPPPFGSVFNDGVPDMAHFIPLDLTENPGLWKPRRPDWDKVLLKKDPAAFARLPLETQQVVDILQSLALDANLETLALKPLPFALWTLDPSGVKKRPEELERVCPNLSKQPTAGSIPAAERPRWFSVEGTTLNTPTRRLYMQRPGEAVFNAICGNCHGPQGDGTGDLAVRLGELTGGETVPANLRDGFLRQDNQTRVFGPDAGVLGITSKALASRYLIFMAMGGTEKLIPKLILEQVAQTPVAGASRDVSKVTLQGSANMLNAAIQFCEATLYGTNRTSVKTEFKTKLGGSDAPSGRLIVPTTGDVELWELLCSINNPPPVRVLESKELGNGSGQFILEHNLQTLYLQGAYPPDALVGTHRGTLETGIRSSNRTPWCVRKPQDPLTVNAITAAHGIGGQLPWCPESFLQPQNDMNAAVDPTLLNEWTRRGAMNAGFAVYAYLEAVSRGTVVPMPSLTSCNLLP